MNQSGIPYDTRIPVATVLACVMLPIPNEARAQKQAKTAPSHCIRKPFDSTYIAPPRITPLSSFWRYSSATAISEKLVAMPTTPLRNIQRTAPGPPLAMAIETPAMLPTPTVEDRDVASAWNGETVPSPPTLPWRPKTCRAAKTNRRNCTPRVAKVRKIPEPISTAIIGGPHTIELTLLLSSRSQFMSRDVRPF